MKTKTEELHQQASNEKGAPEFVNAPVSSEIDERIRQRAYELSQTRNGDGGDELSDWYQAEAEVRSAFGSEEFARPKKQARGTRLA